MLSPATETVVWGGFYVGVIHAGFGTHEVAYPFSVPLIPLSGEH